MELKTEQKMTVKVDGRDVAIDGERNLLELCRKANIEIPTFCYHSNLSVYGACRLCLVDVKGRGVVTSCTTTPEPGMEFRTSTAEIREMRKIAVELLLANHDMDCPTCPKSTSCKLQDLARRMGVREVRFRRTNRTEPIDRSSPAIERNPNRCVLCGDCVRMCDEVQSIGAIDFAHRGSQCTVTPAFGKDLNTVECVHCGQCAAVCPTGALTPMSHIDDVWADLDSPDKVVVVQVAPAVRVAFGEEFGLKAGVAATGQMVAAMRRIGFDQVYDTSFAADLTVIEEGTELLGRIANGGRLPLFTSCCPSWVKFSEQYFPDLLPNLSSCKSPQQMFASLARHILPERLGVAPENLVIVSVMPCTAKKFEARRPEFTRDGRQAVDHVITTQELVTMTREKGLNFDMLEPESFDMPLGFKTGAGVIFGSSGGVTEAVLRFAAEKVTGKPLANVEFHEVRGAAGIREAEVPLGGTSVRVAVVHGLANAREVANRVRNGLAHYDVVEVMACPGGCVGGAGQPVSDDPGARALRARGLYEIDRTVELHKSQDNPVVQEVYERWLGEPGGHVAHDLLHTHYGNRRRIDDSDFTLAPGSKKDPVCVSVCVGTSCYLKGSHDILRSVLEHVEDNGLQGAVEVKGTFCFENCGKAPNVAVNSELIEAATFEKVMEAVTKAGCPTKTPA